MKHLLVSATVLLLVGAGCSKAPDAPIVAPEAAAPVTAPAAAAKPTAAKPAPTPVTVPNAGGISPTNSEDRVVVFTPDGKFDPQNVAVHVGQTVTWINQSNQNVWPASNPHPIHTDCPVLDSKRAIKPGESWSVKFTEAEICSYHNHMQVGTMGQVQVTPDPRK